MLSDRVYSMLMFFSSQNQPLFASNTPFPFSDIVELKNEGYLREESLSYAENEGDIPYSRAAYSITPKGIDALLLHDQEIARLAEEHRIARSSNKWSIVAAIASIIGILVSILLTLLPILMKK